MTDRNRYEAFVRGQEHEQAGRFKAALRAYGKAGARIAAASLRGRLRRRFVVAGRAAVAG